MDYTIQIGGIGEVAESERVGASARSLRAASRRDFSTTFSADLPMK
jgi:hypothetical protein